MAVLGTVLTVPLSRTKNSSSYAPEGTGPMTTPNDPLPRLSVRTAPTSISAKSMVTPCRVSDWQVPSPRSVGNRHKHRPFHAVLLFNSSRTFRGPSSGFRMLISNALPLENLSADPNQDYFSDGMTDELITDPARLPGVRVISRTSTVYYKRTNKQCRRSPTD